MDNGTRDLETQECFLLLSPHASSKGPTSQRPWLQQRSIISSNAHINSIFYAVFTPSTYQGPYRWMYCALLTSDPQASKFKPPRSFASTKHDQPPHFTPLLPSKRLSSDPETTPSQPKRPKCHTGCEKENQFSQDKPLGGVTNLIRNPMPASPRKKVAECIDIDHDSPSASDHSFDVTLEFLEVS